MDLIQFAHGGPEYDQKYPEGIPTSVVVTDYNGKSYDSGLIMFPAGHAANKTADLHGILDTKFKRLAGLATGGDEIQAQAILDRLRNIGSKSAKEIDELYNIKIHGLDSKGSPKKGTKRPRPEDLEY